MQDHFDAYRMWLGIPSEEQPPHHYRLLGIGLFESDREVIERAADRQSEHLKTYQTGPRAALSQKLLTEVAAAAACLRDAGKRGAYDDALRKQLASRESAQSTAEPELPAIQVAASSPLPRAKALPAAKPAGPAIARGKPAKKSAGAGMEIIKIVGGGLLGLVLAVLVVSYFAGKDLLGWSKAAREEQAKQVARRDMTTGSPSPKRDSAPSGKASRVSAPPSESKQAISPPSSDGQAGGLPVPSIPDSRASQAESSSPAGIDERQAPLGPGNSPMPLQTAEDVPFQPTPQAAPATPLANTTPGAADPPDASAEVDAGDSKVLPTAAPASEADGKPRGAPTEAVANAEDPIAAKLEAAKTEFQDLLEKSGERLVQAFDEQSKKLQASTKLSLEKAIQETEKLQAEKAAFIADSKRLPSSKIMQLSVSEYRRALLGGRNRCETAFEKAAAEYRRAENLSAAKDVLEELGRFRQANEYLVARETSDPLAIGTKWEGSKIFPGGTRRNAILEVTERRGSELRGTLTIYNNGTNVVKFEAVIRMDGVAFRFPPGGGQPLSMIGRLGSDTLVIVEDTTTYGQKFELARKVGGK
jgi:hypothetical protein